MEFENNSHYDRMNALVDNGWLGILTLAELRVWLVYHRHAAVDDAIAYPKIETIAKKVGGLKRMDHARRARRSLVQSGLLREVSKRGGRRTAHFEVCVPPKKMPPHVLGGQKMTGQNARHEPPQGARFLPPQSARHEELIEELREEKTFASPLRDAAGAGGKAPQPLLPGMTAAIASAVVEHRSGAENAGKRQRKLSDAQVETWRAFMDWYVATWPRFHAGDDYDWKGNRDAPAALNFLKKQQINWDLEWARQVALLYLEQPEMYGCYDHLLPPLVQRANGLSRKLKQRHTEGNRHVLTLTSKPTAEQRGQFPEPPRQRPPQFGRSAAAG